MLNVICMLINLFNILLFRVLINAIIGQVLFLQIWELALSYWSLT